MCTYQIKREFDRDGFIHIPKNHLEIISDTSLKSLKTGVLDKFYQIFQILYQENSISFPTPYRKRNLNSKQEIKFDLKGITNHIVSCYDYDVDDETYEYPLQVGLKGGYREIVMRNEGRYEMSLSNHQKTLCSNKTNHTYNHLVSYNDQSPSPSSSMELILHSLIDFQTNRPKSKTLQKILSLLLEDENYNLVNISAVIATPGAKEQKWHADGPHYDFNKHQSCHCLNIFIPLIDIDTPTLGPTEIRPGTHYHTRNLAPMMLAAKARKQLQPPISICPMKAGDLLLFDYRVLHRGRSNQSDDMLRPMLVMTFGKHWFKDILNFPKRSIYSNLCNDHDCILLQNDDHDESHGEMK